MKFCRLPITVLLFAFFFISGCTNDPDKMELTQETDQTQEPVTLLFMKTPSNNESIDEAYSKSFERFEGSHPGVKIQLEVVPFAEYYPTILEKFEQGTPPDIFLAYPSYYKILNAKGYLTDLGELFNENDTDLKSSFTKPLLDLHSDNEVLLGVPASSLPFQIIYSKKWFDNAGLPYPEDDWTWEEAVDISKKLSAANGGESKYGLILPVFSVIYEPIIMSNGGSYLSPDGKQASGYLDSKATVEAFEWIRGVYRDSVSPTFVNYFDAPSMVGKTAGMAYSSYDVLSQFGELSTNSDFGIIGLPRFEDGQRLNTMSVGVGFSISSQSNHKILAYELLQDMFVKNTESSMDLFNVGLSSTTAVIDQSKELPPLVASKYKELEYLKLSADHSNRNWTPLLIEYILQSLNDIVDPEGSADIREELTKLAQRIDADLAIRE